MNKRLFFLVVIVVLALIPAVGVLQAQGNGATVADGTTCSVQDANGTSYTDPGCTWHTVTKYNRDGSLQFFRYTDHGTLPAGAVFPTEAVQATFFYACGGCIYEGNYEYVVTPSGNYHSSGPY